MSVFIRNMVVTDRERDRFVEPYVARPFGSSLRSMRTSGPPAIGIELKLVTDDYALVELIQRVISRGGRFEDIVIALARQSMRVDDEYGAKTVPMEPIEDIWRATAVEAIAISTGVVASEVAELARALGVLESPSLARSVGPTPKPREPPPKPTRMGTLELDDDDAEKKR